jgi:hypothetical protein
MKDLLNLSLRNQKGQTAMEYLLLIIVAFSIGVSFKNKMEDFLLNNPNSVLTKQIRDLTAILESDPKYRTFRVLKF